MMEEKRTGRNRLHERYLGAEAGGINSNKDNITILVENK
jgi:hypothetical protein